METMGGQGTKRGWSGATRVAAAAAVVALLVGCGEDAPAPDADPATTPAAGATAAEIPFEATAEDSLILGRTLAWARENGLASEPLGEIIARIAARFVGAPYVPNTLEAEGEERLIINLRTFDCVTLVESVLAMARMVRDGRDSFADFRAELQRIRYRDGAINGYVSRLHYFSDWIGDNERRGLVEDVTRSLGGVQDAERIDFMSRNADAYRQLSNPEVLDAIRSLERRVNERARYVIPQDRIGAAAQEIRNGDVIAATSSVRGLDVAHTGFAYWQDGRLHLLHAPLVGTVVEISERPLAERILRINTQDGIMVARPR
jgi:hypothetical protein